MDESFVIKVLMWTIFLPIKLAIMLIRFIIRLIKNRNT